MHERFAEESSTGETWSGRLLFLSTLVGTILVDSWLFRSAWGSEPWLAPQASAYTGFFLVLVGFVAYSIVSRFPVRHAIRSIPIPFLVLFGGYWLALAGNFLLTQRTPILEYLLVTPTAAYVTIVLLPYYIDRDRVFFAKAIATLAVSLTVLGGVLLEVEKRTEERLWIFTGQDVMTFEGLRISSLFAYSDTFGFVMMIGCLTTLYVVLEERNVLWAGVLGISFLGLLLSEADASYVGLFLGAVLLSTAYDLRYTIGLVSIGAVAVAYMASIGHVGAHLESGFNERTPLWRASLLRLAEDPLTGIGFGDTAAEIEPYIEGRRPTGPHNSYINILLNTGVVAGGLYLTALWYAAVRPILGERSAWNRYLLATLLAIFVVMVFETTTLGGLSSMSVFLGLYVGLALRSR